MKTAAHPIPELAVVPLESLHLHEEVDEGRLKPLLVSLVQDGVLKNPPVVMPLSNNGFVVLDGAHRTLALCRLGLSHALVQVIRPIRDEPVIDTWTQVILDCEIDALLHDVQVSADFEMRLFTPSTGKMVRQVDPSLARLCCPWGACWELQINSNSLQTRASSVHALLSTCSKLGRIERAIEIDEQLLRAHYPGLTGWVIIRPFTLDEIKALAESGVRLPAGISRCVFSPRALRVNYPLEQLDGCVTSRQRHHQFDHWLREHIARRGIRYYPEATFLFDE